MNRAWTICGANSCSEEAWDDALLGLAGVGRAHDLLAGSRDWVVALVLRNLNTVPLLTGQDVVGAISLVVDVFGSHEGSYAAVFVILRQALSVLRSVVVEIEQVVGGSTLVLLSSVEVVSFHFDHLLALHIHLFHAFKSVDFSVVSLFAQVGPLVLDVLELLGAHFLVCHREVLVESLLL